MDRHVNHGRDVVSIEIPLTHRVLTVSAADVDEALSGPSVTAQALAASRFVSTGLGWLDAALSGTNVPPKDACITGAPPVDEQLGDPDRLAGHSEAQPAGGIPGGIRRGQLTEIWGPPGVGKTTFGAQLAVTALRNGSSVMWVDCFHALCIERLAALADAQSAGHGDEGAQGKNLRDGFKHVVCPSLPHFIALMCPPSPATASCIPPDASLLVIDSLSALVNCALPRNHDKKGPHLLPNGKKGPAPHEKRTQVLQFITTALERLAEARNLAIVVLSQCATRVQADHGATLVPAINTAVWDRGIATRLVLFRDWAWKGDRLLGGRFIGTQKLNGTSSYTNFEHMVAFAITEAGLVEEHYDEAPSRSALASRKRKLQETGLDRGGSDEDSNYGWDDDDDSMPNMPPQWQGSEDILLGHRYEEDEEGEKDDEEREVEEEEEPLEDDKEGDGNEEEEESKDQDEEKRGAEEAGLEPEGGEELKKEGGFDTVEDSEEDVDGGVDEGSGYPPGSDFAEAGTALKSQEFAFDMVGGTEDQLRRIRRSPRSVADSEADSDLYSDF